MRRLWRGSPQVRHVREPASRSRPTPSCCAVRLSNGAASTAQCRTGDCRFHPRCVCSPMMADAMVVGCSARWPVRSRSPALGLQRRGAGAGHGAGAVVHRRADVEAEEAPTRSTSRRRRAASGRAAACAAGDGPPRPRRCSQALAAGGRSRADAARLRIGSVVAMLAHGDATHGVHDDGIDPPSGRRSALPRVDPARMPPSWSFRWNFTAPRLRRAITAQCRRVEHAPRWRCWASSTARSPRAWPARVRGGPPSRAP